ncbi:hypothetical protein Taro_056269 [Colocasia esculenta]|uniref:Pentatricopeptide repeat-containing protein n=1 Tax=Colocasia esculenta TaxID=4460 RepID=A0A843XV99_COLES|nr:hypothetical protein [Colocasia esculenta]
MSYTGRRRDQKRRGVEPMLGSARGSRLRRSAPSQHHRPLGFAAEVRCSSLSPQPPAATSSPLAANHLTDAAVPHSPPPTVSDEDGHGQLIAEIAGKVCEAIRHRTRWEATLLDDLSPVYPRRMLFHPGCVREVLRRQSSNPILSLRYFLWVSSVSSSFSPDTATSTALFERLVDARAWGAVLFVIRSTKCRPEKASLESFLKRLCANRVLEEALEALALLKKEMNFTPSLHVWNTALRTSVRGGMPSLAWRFYSYMMQSGVIGDVSTVGYLIRALCAENRLSEAYSLLRGVAKDGIVPDVISLTKLVSGFTKEKNYGTMSELLHMMIAMGRPPDIFTYQTIIHGLCENGMGAEAFRVFEELKQRGYSPDVATYTSMIDGLCKMGRTEDALRLWREMVERGLEPNEYTYNVLIDHYWKMGNPDGARRIYHEMLAKEHCENLVICNTMIAGLSLQGLMEESVEIFKEMPSKGIDPDVITYNTLIQGFCKNGKIIEAMKVYNELLCTCLHPTCSSYEPLLQNLCKEGKMQDAINMLNDMVPRQPKVLLGHLSHTLTPLACAVTLRGSRRQHPLRS